MVVIRVSYRVELYAYRTVAIRGCVKYHIKEERLRRQENKTDSMRHANQVTLQTYVRRKFVSQRHIFWFIGTVLSTAVYSSSFRQIYPAGFVNEPAH